MGMKALGLDMGIRKWLDGSLCMHSQQSSSEKIEILTQGIRAECSTERLRKLQAIPNEVLEC